MIIAWYRRHAERVDIQSGSSSARWAHSYPTTPKCGPRAIPVMLGVRKADR